MSPPEPATSPSQNVTLAALIDDLSARHGNRDALIWADGKMSFRQLGERASEIACGLSTLGARKGTRLGILMPNRADWLAIAFAAWKIGAVVVPLNTLSRKPELEHALRYADVTILVTVPTFLKHNYIEMVTEICGLFTPSPANSRERVGVRATATSNAKLKTPNFARHCATLRRVIASTSELDDLVASGQTATPRWLKAMQSTVADTDIAAIFFTSGTTALPKGVVHTHASMLHAANNVGEALGLTEDDRTWGYLPFFFTGGLVAVALATLSRGGAVLLQEVFDAGEALELMSAHRCTTLFAWPHQAEALIAHPDFETTRLYLRKGVGANTKWASRLYPPDHQAVGTWGMTESGPMATASSYDEPQEIRAGAHGRARPGVELRVIDPDTGRELGAGEEGELLIRGVPLMQQYYKVARGECFDADGFFHTGDLARIDAGGLLHFLGRLKDVIKTAGVNVAAAEVEAVLQQHPSVKVAHVVGVVQATRGENVAAAVILEAADLQSSRATNDEQRATQLRDFCSRQLATYKVPRHFIFMAEAELPTLGSGKVDKKTLRKMIEETVPKP